MMRSRRLTIARPRGWPTRNSPISGEDLFDTGLALTRGNSSTETFTLSSKAVRETPRDKITLYSTYIYGNDGSTSPSRTTANALAAGLRGDYELPAHASLSLRFADYETNALQHLDLRQFYGGGFGYHAIKTARTTFDMFGGISYDRDPSERTP